MTPPDWRATYRLQLRADFGFDDALAILPYLRRLGVSHVYTSPISAARPGSSHGYDVTDPTRINPELGGDEGFRRFSDGLHEFGMGMLLDIVPNHMATHRTNPWWMSTLAGGRHAPAASIFDVDWDRHPRVLMPVLNDTLAETLGQGTITLQVDAAEGWLVACAYGAHAWPLRVEDTTRLLDAAGLAEAARAWREDGSADLHTGRAALRQLDEVEKERLEAVLTVEDLPATIERQHWQPIHWRSGRDALSARRFFNVNELVGVRAEDASVFALTHRLPLALLREGRINGLRIDHIDGLAETILRGKDPPAAVLRQRFQQLTGPLMAKGLEDTEFYRNVALLSVNEVGGNPEEPGVSVAAFHAWAAQRAAERPRDLTPLATHDTKRGAEVRARLNLLSVEPQAWIERVTRWQQMNDPLHPADRPDRADEWLIYQTLLGAWPIDADRLCEYLTKAMREAKRHTRWEYPQEAYEVAVLDFATALLESPQAAGFRMEVAAYVERLAIATRINALAQTVLHLTLPGIPDIYQGTEGGDFSLVDPDNRRPVQYRDLDTVADSLSSLELDRTTGAIKQGAVRRLLQLRTRQPRLFEGYQALDLASSDGWIGYTRGHGRLLVAVPTRAPRLVEVELPIVPDNWHDVLADRPFVPTRFSRVGPLVLTHD